MELGKYGITVNGYAPGAIDTDMRKEVLDGISMGIIADLSVLLVREALHGGQKDAVDPSVSKDTFSDSGAD